MNFFAQLVPGLSLSWTELLTLIVGLMGALALMYGVLLEAERRQDAVWVVGSASLFVYALAEGDRILMFAMTGMFLVAGRELIQIMRGKHHHTVAEMQKYEHYHGK